MLSQNQNAVPWWKSAVVYEVYVDKFAGTFREFITQLDYLQTLGITCIHLLPHYSSPLRDDGYDVSDYMSVRSSLGTLDDFREFVKEAHERGMRVLVDFVLNHTSTEHPWFLEAKSSLDNPKRNFYLWSKTGMEYKEIGNAFPDLKEKNWIHNEVTDDFYFSKYYPEQADLNWDNPEVFAEMMKVIDFWANIGVDGFRLDAAPHVIKREGSNSEGLPETHAVLKKIRAYVDQNHPGIILLGEIHDRLEKMIEYFGDGDECHLAYHFPMVEQIFLGIARKDMSGVEKLREASSDIPENCAWLLFLRHHDEMSLATLTEEERSELLGYFDPEKKYRFSSGTSMRIATMFGGDKEEVLRAYRLLFSIPGSHVVYYGDEIGMENGPLSHGEKDTRKCLRERFNREEAETEKNYPYSFFSAFADLIAEHKPKAVPEVPPQETPVLP